MHGGRIPAMSIHSKLFCDKNESSRMGVRIHSESNVDIEQIKDDKHSQN